ncbi:hypothetical protein D3C73_587820 [compost metagenome]
MRRPAEEDHGGVAFLRAVDLRQHACFAGLDDLEARVLEAEGVLVDHRLDQAVAIVARLDAVDLAVELFLEFGDVGEVMQALVVQRLRDGEGVLGALEVGAYGFHGAGIAVGLDVVFHGRHPVAQEHVHVLAVGQGLVGHGHGNHGGLGLVAEGVEHDAGGRGCRGDVGPADIGEVYGTALRRFCGLRQNRQTKHGGQQQRRGTFHGWTPWCFFWQCSDWTTALIGCGWMAFWRQLYHGALQSSRYDHVPVKI